MTRGTPSLFRSVKRGNADKASCPEQRTHDDTR